MSEHSIDPLAAFETQLRRDLQALSRKALRSVDATELAHELATSALSPRLSALPSFNRGGRLGSRSAHRRAAALVAAAVAIAVGGIGFAVWRQPHGVTANPSPTPSASASPDRAVVDLTEVQSSWQSLGTRKSRFVNGNHSTVVDAQSNIVIGPGTITINEFRDDVLNSVALEPDGALQVEMLSAAFDWTCRVGDAGAYGARLSPTGQIMTLTPLDDACEERAGILEGPWNRTDIGPLAAGDHVSKLFQPFGMSGQLSYAVPLGWEEITECWNCFILHKVGDGAGLTINVMASVVPTSLRSECNEGTSRASSAPTGIAAWLATLPNLAVAKPTPAITIGGLRGVAVDLTVRPDASSLACRFLDSDGGDVTLADPDAPAAQLGVQNLDNTRIILLDRSDGQTMAIVITADNIAGSEAGLAEAMTVVQSFEFAR